LCRPRASTDERHDSFIAVDVDNMLAECSTVAEVHRPCSLVTRWSVYVESVVTRSSSTHVQLEVDNSDEQRLTTQCDEMPVAVSEHVVAVRVAGTGDVLAATTHHRYRCIRCASTRSVNSAYYVYHIDSTDKLRLTR